VGDADECANCHAPRAIISSPRESYDFVVVVVVVVVVVSDDGISVVMADLSALRRQRRPPHNYARHNRALCHQT
jgi:hypothetical protein